MHPISEPYDLYNEDEDDIEGDSPFNPTQITQIAVIHSPSSLELVYRNNPHFFQEKSQLNKLITQCNIKNSAIKTLPGLNTEIQIEDIGKLWHLIEKSLFTKIILPVSWPLLTETYKTLNFFHRQNWARHSIVLFSDPAPIHRLNSPIGFLLGATVAHIQFLQKCGISQYTMTAFKAHIEQHFAQAALQIFTLGGTIDKDPLLTEPHVGDPIIATVLKQYQCAFNYKIESISRKDSQLLTSSDLEDLYIAINMTEASQDILITCGTDQMVAIAQSIQEGFGDSDRVIVFTGAMTPYWLQDPKLYDAPFNIAYALEAITHLEPGVYIAMNGQIFFPENTKKSASLKEFVEL